WRSASRKTRTGREEKAMYNRRELGSATFAALAAPFLAALAPAGSEAGLGVQTCSFRGLTRAAGSDPIDTLVDAVAACGVRHCELFAPQSRHSSDRRRTPIITRWRRCRRR